MVDRTEAEEQGGARSTDHANKIFDLVLNMNAMENSNQGNQEDH
jgi:hypothetical protein